MYRNVQVLMNGGGTLYYQICPHCGKKKVIYDWHPEIAVFKCTATACRRRFDSETLIRKKYKSQLN